MSALILETNLLPSFDMQVRKQSWHESMDNSLIQLHRAFFQEEEEQCIFFAKEWSSPCAVIFQEKRGGSIWNKNVLNLESKIVPAYQTIELTLPIDRSEEDSKLFFALVSQWHRERRNAIWIADIAMCPSYQKIIAMGKERVLPLILKQLIKERKEPDHWFWALRILTDDNPVPQEHQGDMVRMAEDWIDWGQKNGYAG